MNRPPSVTIVGSLVVAVLAVSTLVWMLSADRSALAQAMAEPGGAGESSQPVAVTTSRPDRRTLVRELALPASMEAYASAELYAKTSGYVAEVKVDIGSRVGAGDELIRIDVPEMLDELRQAEAALAARRASLAALKAKATRAGLMVETAAAEELAREAEAELQQITTTRKEELVKGNAITTQEFDEARIKLSIAQAQVSIATAKRAAAAGDKATADADVGVGEAEIAVAEANVSRLRTLMEYASIKAPFDGVITKRQIDPGDFVRSAAQGAATPLLTVARIDRVRVVLDVPESDCRFVTEGTPLELRLAACTGDPVSLFVSRTAKALNPATRTMRAEADLDNPDLALSPGMFAHVAVKLETKQAAMLVPSRAIRVHGRDVFVLVADGGVARAVPVEVGYDDGEWSEINSGLDGSEAVIAAAKGVLAAGMPVRATEAKSTPAALSATSG